MPTSTLTLLELQAAIIREPLVVPADATVMEAIALMSMGRSQCDAENHSDNHQQQFQQEARSSCVLVLEDEKLIGVMTERDVVRLSAQQQDLDRLLVREVMAHPVVTLRESDLTDLFLAVNLLQQYHIRHLPLLDEQDLLVGMVTHESLRQISRPIDLMRLRLVSEVMTSDVVCAAADRSMLAIAQMMAEQKISSVMIVEPSRTDTSLQIPVGIVTERDVVQFQALGLNLETYIAHTIMSTPIFSVKPEDNLLTVQHIMEQRLIRRLAVTGEFGELLGIVTQTSLLQALNPTEIYNLAKVLEAKVEQLESEKVTLLENRNVDLESQVEERTASLLEAEKALQQLNQSLEAKVQERTQEVQLQAQMLEQIHDAVISTALDGTILTWNIGAEKLYEYKSHEAIGQNITMLYLNEDLPLMESEVFSPLIEKGTHEIELRNRTKSGNIIYISLRLSTVRDAIGNICLIGCSNNISDRKQAENALRESQALLQTVLDAFPLSVFWKDRQSVYLGCNQLFANTSGIKSPLEAIGKSNFDFSYTEEEALAYLADDQQVMESGLAKLNIEETITLASGEQQWIQTNKIPLRDSEGDVIGVMGTFQDISDRKQAEKALKESEQSYASLMAAAPVGIFRTDAMGHCTYVNDHWCRISGLTLASAIGDGWRQGLYSEDRQSISDEWYRSAQEDRPFSLEYRFQRPDGVITWVYGQSVVKLDADGIITGYVGTIMDINDRKQAELQLQKVSDRLALALNSGAIGCWEWNIQQNMAFWDERMYELYGVCKEKDLRIVYEIWAGAIHPEDRAESEMTTQQIATGQVEEYDTEFRVVHPDGSIHFIKAYGALKRDASGNPLSIIGINFDISDRKQAEAQLQKINDELLRATRLKDEFLANMSHELRTPLNSILGMNEALQEEVFGSINERQLKSLQTIESSSRHLLALINDILDVAKIESGEVMLELTATEIDSLCKSSLAFIKQQALTKRIQLIPRIPKHLPEIMLDERRIRQVLINLLNNAVKFTLEGGTITLEVSQVQLESSPTNLTPLNYLKIAVIDTGIGISAENIQKLFQPFMQIDSALNRQYNGTGLGLALVKRLVEIHGGNVELTSEMGVGSCFAINLPINIGSPAIEEQTEDLSGQSQISQSQTEELILPLILLAEDNEANIATFSSYLEAKGHRILLATDGQQAIDLAKSHSPDLILMDIQMPVIDGMEAIKQIRLNPNLVDIPIIALTALAMAGDREKCLTAGANEYLAKPVKLKQLATSIQQFLMQRKNNV